MKKKLTLLIFLLPVLLMGQVTLKKNGTITFDVGGKKNKQDTVQPVKEPSLQPDDGEDDVVHFKKKDKKRTGSGYVATSASSLTIGTGDQILTTQSGLSYAPGDKIRLTNGPANYMEGTVSSYSDTNMVVNITKLSGDGTYSNWNLNIVKDAPASLEPKTANKNRINEGEKEDVPEFKRDGIFKAVLHAGINGAQIDGDGYAGYNHIGADVGVGVLVRLHKFFSLGMDINYSMKGAKQKLNTSGSGQGYDSLGNIISLFKYRVDFDYIEVPIALIVQDKKYIMFSAGLSMAALVHYREQNEAGVENTNAPPNGPPKNFDFCAFGALDFVIHKNYVLGIKFSYSLIPLRGPQYQGLTRLFGEYNNVLNFHFAYIIDKNTFKKKH